MKKIVLLLLTTFSFSFAHSQTPQIGVKVGVNYSNLAGDLQHEDINDNKLGFVGGIGTSFPLISDGFLSIAPELLYSQKGYQYRDQEFKIGNVTYKRKGDIRYEYLDLPVLLKINAAGLIFEAGPLASYLLGIRDNTEEKVGSKDYEETKVVSKGDLNKFEIGYAAGIGYLTPLGLTANLRYNGSISHLAKDDDDELGNARHSLFQLTVGYMIGGSE